MEEEIWKSVPGYEGWYEASSLGRVRSLDRVIVDALGRVRRWKGRDMKRTPAHSNEYGTREVLNLRGRDGTTLLLPVHRVVAMTFHGLPPAGYECCHNDGNPGNNRADNLRWDTPTNNQADKVLHHRTNRGEKCASSKMTWGDVVEIRRRCAAGERIVDVAADYPVNYATVRDVVAGATWRYSPEQW